VCKSWKFGVDTFLQNHRYHYSIGLGEKPVDEYAYRYFCRGPTRLLGHYEFEGISETEKFIATFSPDTNPFISRHVHCRYDDDRFENSAIIGDIARYRESFTNLLQLLGHHVWNAEFTIELEHTKTNFVDDSKLIRVYSMIHHYLCRI